MKNNSKGLTLRTSYLRGSSKDVGYELHVRRFHGGSRGTTAATEILVLHVIIMSQRFS